MVFVALGIHAVLLFTPLTSGRKPPPKETEKPVKISQLPASKPKPKPKVAVKKPPAAKVNRPKQVPPTPKPPTPAPEKEASEDTKKDPFADFPHHPQSQAGCYAKESCYEVKGLALNAVAEYFRKALPGKKFTVTPLVNDPGKVVFQVTKGDKSLFLNIFQDGKNTVYALAPDEIASLKDLQGAIEIPPALFELMANLPSEVGVEDPSLNPTIPTPEDFNEPTCFFTNVGGESEGGFQDNPEFRNIIEGSPRIAGGGEEPSVFYETFFEQEVTSIFDEVKSEGNYCGGPLYRLKKGGLTLFLHLVPHKRAATVDSIVILWLKDPR